MSTVWKFPLGPHGDQKLWLPEGAQILCVQVMNGEAFLWARCNLAKTTESPPESREMRRVFVCATGDEIHPDAKVYIGTIQIPYVPMPSASKNVLVFHVSTTEAVR